MRLVSCLFTLFLYFSICASCSKTDEIIYPKEDGLLPLSDSVLLKSHLKVLDIGNSYTDDATAYLPYLVKKLGVNIDDFCLYKAILGGASFKNWYDTYYDKYGGSYKISKVLGGLNIKVDVGVGSKNDGRLFRSLLNDVDWDVIIIHPKSSFATNYDEWWGHDNAGYLSELLDLIMNSQPKCNLGFLLVHSTADDYPMNKEHSSLLRWEHIANATQLFVNDFDIKVLIPYGTAIQNLRTTELNNDAALTRDGTHLGYGLACYTAACCYYETLLSPRTGVSVLGKDIPYEVEEIPEESQYSVTDANMETAQKAAVFSCLNPYTCINPNDFEIEDFLTN